MAPRRRQRLLSRLEYEDAYHMYFTAERGRVEVQRGYPTNTRDRKKVPKIHEVLSAEWNAMAPRKKRWWEYQLDKNRPLKVDHYHTYIGTENMYPTPEQVAKYTHGQRRDEHGKSAGQYSRGRDQYMKELRNNRRALLTRDERRLMAREHHKSLRARGLLRRVIWPPGPLPDDPLTDGRSSHWSGPGTLMPRWTNNQLDAIIRHLPNPGQATQWLRYKWLHIAGNRKNCTVSLFRRVNAFNVMYTYEARVVKVEHQSIITKYPVLNDDEGQLHEQLYRACPEFVTRIYAHNVTADEADNIRWKRLYFEWAPHGDLLRTLVWYSCNPSAETKSVIPEPFLWYCFLAIARVALVSKNGQVSHTRAVGWNPIVNWDFKPGNVLLDHPNPNAEFRFMRQYPTPKVTDFGMAGWTQAGQQATALKNPQKIRGYGTPDHQPPELIRRDDEFLTQLAFPNKAGTRLRVNQLVPWQPPPAPLSPDNSLHAGIDSWTTVWEVGIAMHMLMSLEPDTISKGVDFSAQDCSRDYPSREWLRPRYSGRLVELVYQCLHAHPAERIAVERLHDEIMEACAHVQKTFDEAPPWAPGPQEVAVTPDKYPIAANHL